MSDLIDGPRGTMIRVSNIYGAMVIETSIRQIARGARNYGFTNTAISLEKVADDMKADKR